MSFYVKFLRVAGVWGKSFPKGRDPIRVLPSKKKKKNKNKRFSECEMLQKLSIVKSSPMAYQTKFVAIKRNGNGEHGMTGFRADIPAQKGRIPHD